MKQKQHKFTPYFLNEVLRKRPCVESIEVSEGIVIDYDTEGQIVGIDINNAALKINLKELVLNRLPVQTQKLSA